MKTLEQWIDNYASETLHSWGLKGYPNLLDELKEALMFAVKEAPRTPEQPTTPKPRCDAQGRLLEAPALGTIVWYFDGYGVWLNDEYDNGALERGILFVSKNAEQAELTRLKCLQRLRGMAGFTPYGGHRTNYGSVNFEKPNLRDKAEATITPEERAAFLYREPTKE
jgi:hypothetical protein